MKTILLATAAVALAGTAAWALDDDNRHTRIRVAGDHSMTRTQDARVIEIRSEDGGRTIHMQGSGSESTLNVNGQDIRIRGDHVTIDGQEVETDGASFIIIDGDEIRVVNDGDLHRFDGQFELHMAERAEDFARMAEDMGNFRFEFDAEGMRAEVMASLEAALAGLDSDIMIDHDSHRWEELSEAERESARASMQAAREEIREAMQTMRAEMRDAQLSGDDEMRRVRVELSHASREASRAGRDEARAARDEARAERHHSMHREAAANDSGRVEQDIRVERSDDGRRQVWVNDEEQTGDDLIGWLNQIEAERLAGGPAGERRHQERRIIHLDREDGASREIDLAGRRVIVLRSDDDHNGERVFEIEIEENDGNDEK